MAGESLTSTRSGSCGLPTSAEHVLVDTSAALALVQRENLFHKPARARLLACRRGLSGHAAAELLSVLTRLPPPHRLTPVAALRLEEINFPESRFLSATDTKQLLREFAEAGLAGGAVYDGLVGAAARKHKLTLVTCDRRAEPTYRVLGVNYEVLSPISQ
ncbi:MAG TPA: type II toxin-antitoxin system VapC family toxin [Mycobacterium sp.]|uniref:type II toxin-antitoxin system VapC family toxin n=1 Tax=Mycobacterium sp. TaxID=1785 RepID=UPI002D3E671C|nr:type II toxin-antitoxin system VapC family toxin [Mycobacterium sp.]HZU48712.1 type II toxin-antitoxin system VapC family toxin [Mycobacterium sp.]